MKCLRIYATSDGESHFGEAEIPLSLAELFPDRPRLYLSKQHTASKVRFVRIPAEVKEGGWHTTPERLLAVWLDSKSGSRQAMGKFGAFLWRHPFDRRYSR